MAIRYLLVAVGVLYCAVAFAQGNASHFKNLQFGLPTSDPVLLRYNYVLRTEGVEPEVLAERREEMYRQMVDAGEPPEGAAIIADALSGAGETVSGLFEVRRHGSIMSFTKSAPNRELGALVDYSNGELLCTVYNRPTERGADILRANLYGSASTFGTPYLGWFLGLLPLDKLFDVNHPTFNALASEVRISLLPEPNRSHHLAARWHDGTVESITVTYGSADQPGTVCKFLKWKKVGGDRVPASIEIKELEASGKLSRTLTIELLSIEVGGTVDVRDFKSLGPKGEDVMDCRFGIDNCVSYAIGDSPLTDEQVKSLLQKKKANKFAPPTQPADWTRIALVISGVALLAASCVVWYVLRKRRG